MALIRPETGNVRFVNVHHLLIPRHTRHAPQHLDCQVRNIDLRVQPEHSGVCN